MIEWKSTLINYYLKRNALAVGSFNLTGGGTSNFYIDGRLVTTYPPGLRVITRAMKEIIHQNHLLSDSGNLVAPVLSGIPIITALALELDMPFIMDRGKPKEHGLSKRFEGKFNNSTHCLIIDDLITIGSTLVQTVNGIRDLGKSVSDVLVVVDREEGGSEALSNIDVKLHVLLTKTELMRALEEHKNGQR